MNTAEFEELDLKPLPPREAVRFFERKGFRIGFDFRDVFQQEHARAFTVAKVMRRDLLETIRAEVQKGLEDGIPFETFRRNLTPILQREGWWGVKEVVDPLTGQMVKAQLGSPRRLRIIFDTNLRTARAAGRWERIQRNKARRPFLRYSQIQRPTKRDTHMRWHGLIRPVDDPIWNRIYPPNGWNCGCIVQQLTRAEAERRGITDDREAQAITRNVRQFQNKRTGEILSVTRGVDPSFDFNIGKEHMRGLAKNLESTLSLETDLFVRQQTLEAVVAGEGFSDFLAEPQRHGFFPVILLGDSVRRRAGASSPTIRLRDTTLQRLREERPEIVESDYRSLPRLGADPDLAIQDGERMLLLRREGDAWLLVTTRPRREGRPVEVQSIRRVNQAEAERLAERGRVLRRKR